MDRAELARLIDHTLLAPDATAGQIAMFCAEATELQVGAVCVSPNRLPLGAGALPDAIAVATVVGFPSGSHRGTVKAAEAARAVADGADEIDMVINIAAARADDRDLLVQDILAVADAVHEQGAILKVIIETSLLTDEQKVLACEAAVEAGADFVKTSTGFNGGGATVEDVALMRKAVGPDLGVKASGGIRSLEDARAMIDAGATRIGASSGVAIVEGEQGAAGY